MSSRTERDGASRLVHLAFLLAGLVAIAGVAVTVGAAPGPGASVAPAADTGSLTTAAEINYTERTVTNGDAAPGGAATVEVFVDTEGELEAGELVWVTDEFSSSFEAVQLRDGDPGVSGAGPNAANDEFQAIWNEDANNYTVVYDAAVPLDASPGDEYEIGGEVEVSGNSQTLASETVTVTDGIPGNTSVRLRSESTVTEPGSAATYEVLVTGADEGVGSYSVNVSTANASVGSISGVELANAADSDRSEVAGDGSWATVDADLGSDDHEAGSGVVIADLTVDADRTGSTSLAVDGAAVGNASGAAYDVSSVWSSSLAVVDDADAVPGEDGADSDDSDNSDDSDGSDNSDDSDGSDNSDGSDDSDDSDDSDGSGDSDDADDGGDSDGSGDSDDADDGGDSDDGDASDDSDDSDDSGDSDGSDDSDDSEDSDDTDDSDASDDSGETADEDGSGFGFTLGVVSVLLASLLARRRI